MEQEIKRKQLKCVVVSDKMQKSRVGKIERLVKHPVVGKYVKKTTKIMFHDERNESALGDEVLIHEGRPKSARKSYVLSSIVTRSKE